MNDNLARIASALEEIATYFKIIVEEGITIYEHQDGTENQN